MTKPAPLTLYRRKSDFNDIWVMEEDNARYLRFGDSWQGAQWLNDAYSSEFSYPEYFHLAFVLRPAIRRVLVIGLGAAMLPKQLLRDYPHLRIDVVEIDPVVVRVARRYFGLRSDRRMRIRIGDARDYLLDPGTPRYDFIVVDAYAGDEIPRSLISREFISSVRKCLTEIGLMAVNVLSATRGPKTATFNTFSKAMVREFRERYLFIVGLREEPRLRGLRNFILMAGNQEQRDGKEVIKLIRRSSLIREEYRRHARDHVELGRNGRPRIERKSPRS